MFLTLTTFSTTGGIEKVCRIVCRALFDLSEDRLISGYRVLSLHDRNSDRQAKYIPAEMFSGFSGRRISFLSGTFSAAKTARLLILSHINLALPALMLKKVFPALRVVLFAHGIEIWREQKSWKKELLQVCDQIIAVSDFTRRQIIEKHQIDAAKITVLNNCIDPFFERPETFTKPGNLLKKYVLKKDQPVLFALTRMSTHEQYKGYDKVISAIARIREKYPDIVYILGGKYDEAERRRIEKMAAENGVSDHIRFAGFVYDHELTDYFRLADVFCLPSKKEGFGIAFIEAMYCGLPVVAGNRDGSIDALDRERLGKAVDPDDVEGIAERISQYLSNPSPDKKALSDACYTRFNYATYKQLFAQLISS